VSQGKAAIGELKPGKKRQSQKRNAKTEKRERCGAQPEKKYRARGIRCRQDHKTLSINSKKESGANKGGEGGRKREYVGAQKVLGWHGKQSTESHSFARSVRGVGGQ